MAPSALNARAVRQRKLAKNTAQSVLREDEFDNEDYLAAIAAITTLDTGVEKSEEKEYHLQAALAGGDKDATQEIPAPPANEIADIDYDALYPLRFGGAITYIRFSQTVEDCTGCQYNMTTEDDVFLTKYNEKRPNASKCSEDDFEKIMWAFEEEAAIQAPYASVDGTVIKYEDLHEAIKRDLDGKTLAFAKDIWGYWKDRKQAAGRIPLQPHLKEEKDPSKDEGDPYICFRRRDARQTRKTRGRDTQSTEKLKRLRKEIEEGRALIAMSIQREVTKTEMLSTDRKIFTLRLELKRTKIKLGIKENDDDLITQKPQKRKTPPEHTPVQRPSGTPLRMPARSDGRAIDAELILLKAIKDQKENMLKQEIQQKVSQHQEWNSRHVDLTREPLAPVLGQAEMSFRPVTAQYQLITPPSSLNSASLEPSTPMQEKPDPLTTRHSSPPEDDEPHAQASYRRRIGRGGLLWVDRRYVKVATRALESSVSDRWKYDQDDDDDQPVYEVDPYDTKALKFRSTIPLPPHLAQRSRSDGSVQQARPGGQRAITAVQPPPQPT